MYRFVLIVAFLVMSCQAKVQDSVSSSSRGNNSKVCNFPSVMEELQCYEEKNTELKKLLKEQGNEKKSDYRSWSKQVNQSCEHLKLLPEETPQGDGIGLIRQICYYKAYSSRLKAVQDSIASPISNTSVGTSGTSAIQTSKKITSGNGKVLTYQPLSLPISSEMIDNCSAAKTEGRQIAACKAVVHYWLSRKEEESIQELLGIAKNANAPIFEQNFAWVLPTRDGIVYLSSITEESGDDWFLVSENSSGVSKYFEFGAGSIFTIDKGMKITVKMAGKKVKRAKYYQIEEDGSISQLN